MYKRWSFLLKTMMIGCAFAVHATAFGQTDLVSSWEQEREKAALIFKAADEQGRYSEQLNIADLNYLPINLSRTISNINYAIAIVDYELESNYISATAYARVILPQVGDAGKEKVLFFATKDLHLSYDGNIIGGATLALLGDVEIPLMGGRATLILNGNFDQNSGQTTTATFLTMDCKGFKELSIDADVVFSERFIKKAECNGNNCQVAASFQTVVSDWNDLLLKIDLPKFEIVGLSDFIFDVRDAVFDMSDKRNEQMSFPSDYASQFLTSGAHELWKGVYIKKLNVTLPPQFEEKGSDERISFEAEHLLIDNNGCSGLFSADNLLPIDNGSASGWRFSVDQFKLELQANQLVAGGFGGRIGLPVSDTSTLQYTAFITQDNQYSLTVTPPKNLVFDVFSAQVELSKNSLISLNVENKKFVPEAKLSGTMSIAAKTASANTEKIADFKGIKFQDLHLRTSEPYISIGALGYEGELKVMNFPVSINKIELKTIGNDLSLLFGINLALGTKGFDIGSSTTLEIIGSMKDSEGRKHWSYKETKVSDIAIEAAIADICKIKGALSIKQNDPVYGNGFQGKIGLSFEKILEGLSVDVRAIFGRTDFNYWLVDGLAGLPGQGIPVFSGLNLKGFGGGASFKMTADGSDISMPTGAKYIPSEENGLGLKAAVLLGMPQGNALNIEASFEVGFNKNGGLSYAGLFGQATFMGNIPGVDNIAGFVGDKFNSMAELEKQFVGGDPAQKEILQKMKLYDPNKSAATTYKASQTPGQNGILATMSMKFDFTNNSFHGNFDVFANMAGGLIKGSGTNNSAGKAVMHIEPGKWYLHIGSPQNRVGLEMNLAGLLKAKVGAYFMIGDEMPEMPNPPDQVVKILAESGATVKDNRNLQALKAGRGFAFGTDFSVNTGDINVWIVYAKFGAGVGFDMMLADYGQAQCAGRSGPIGMDGWFATGQAYAYLQGEVGVNVNLLAVKKKITILKGGAAALLQAQLPNPFWMAGNLGMNFEVLNGLVKGSVNLKIELGERCEIIKENPSPLGVDVISDLTPHTGTNDVDVFTAPQAAFNMAINTAFEIDDNGTNKWYRLKLEEFNVYDKGALVQGAIKWNSENTVATFEAHEILPPTTSLSAKIKVVFEEYKNGYWSILKENGKTAEESKTVDFITGDAPDYIPTSNIAYCYPVVDQHFFYVNEDQNGYIQLKQGQSYLLSDAGVNYQIVFTTNSGQTEKVPFTYEESNKKIAFSTALLTSGQHYKLQLVSFSANAGIQGQDAERRRDVAQEEVGKISIRDAKAGAVTRDDLGNTLLAYDFSTSRYKTFAEKIKDLKKNQHARWPTSMETYFLQCTLSNAEGFDEVELVGNIYTNDKPLITIEAALDDDYFVKKIGPLLYNNYPILGEIRITNREVNIYGVPPAKALPIDDLYLTEVRNDNFYRLAPIFFPYYYDVAKIYNNDFYNIQGQVVNEYKDNLPGAGNMAGASFPLMNEGAYKANMQYKLPGGKNGSAAVFTYDFREVW